MGALDGRFSELFARVRVAFTSLNKDNLILANVTGVGLGQGKTETVHGTPLHGVVGLLVRPKAPEPPPDGAAASGFGVRIGDSIVPISMVDKRIAKAFGVLVESGIALAGYLGQRVLLEPGLGGGARVTIAISAGVSPLSIVLDTSPEKGRNTITGETRVTGAPGGDGAAVPVLIAPDLATMTALVAAVNALGAYVNGIVPGTVPGVPIASTIDVSATLKATPT